MAEREQSVVDRMSNAGWVATEAHRIATERVAQKTVGSPTVESDIVEAKVVEHIADLQAVEERSSELVAVGDNDGLAVEQGTEG